jgi:cobalt-zinc-cadmium efflux system membrane fusion protein
MKHKTIFTMMIMLMLAACISSEKKSMSEERVAQPSSDNRYVLSTEQFERSGMKLGQIEMAEFHDIIKANGVIDVPPANRASVSAYFGGTVTDIRLIPGQWVDKGDILFVMENPEYVQVQQEYLETKGQLTYLKSDFERQRNLVQDNVTSQKNFLKAESEYTVMRVKLEALRMQLKLMNIDPENLTIDHLHTMINIYSPISGYVTNVDITRGAFLNPTHEAVRLVDTDHIHLELNIFEKDLSKVKIGQAITFKIQEDETQEYDAKVHLVNKTVDPENRSIGIHGHLTDEKLSVRFNPGMYVEADIYTASETKMALPHDALVDMDGQYYVLVLENSSNGSYAFVKHSVITGKSSNTHTEILNAGDFDKTTSFLIDGSFNLITE